MLTRFRTPCLNKLVSNNLSLNYLSFAEHFQWHQIPCCCCFCCFPSQFLFLFLSCFSTYGMAYWFYWIRLLFKLKESTCPSKTPQKTEREQHDIETTSCYSKEFVKLQCGNSFVKSDRNARSCQFLRNNTPVTIVNKTKTSLYKLSLSCRLPEVILLLSRELLFL